MVFSSDLHTLQPLLKRHEFAETSEAFCLTVFHLGITQKTNRQQDAHDSFIARSSRRAFVLRNESRARHIDKMDSLLPALIGFFFCEITVGTRKEQVGSWPLCVCTEPDCAEGRLERLDMPQRSFTLLV